MCSLGIKSEVVECVVGREVLTMDHENLQFSGISFVCS